MGHYRQFSTRVGKVVRSRILNPSVEDDESMVSDSHTRSRGLDPLFHEDSALVRCPPHFVREQEGMRAHLCGVPERTV